MFEAFEGISTYLTSSGAFEKIRNLICALHAWLKAGMRLDTWVVKNRDWKQVIPRPMGPLKLQSITVCINFISSCSGLYKAHQKIFWLAGWLAFEVF